MLLSTYLMKILFGRDFTTTRQIKRRGIVFEIPKKEEGDIDRKIEFSTDDGLVTYFVKRIEKIENELKELKLKEQNLQPQVTFINTGTNLTKKTK